MPDVTAVSVPIGTVISYVGKLETVNELASEGWLLCDGRSIPNTQYPELFNTIGTGFGGSADPDFNLPDLRGMFLRGADLDAQHDPDIAGRAAQPVNGNTGKTVDAIGSRQSDQFAAHTHDVTASYLFGPDETYVVSGGGSTPVGPASCANTGGSETRPKNVYVYYLILGDKPSAAPAA